MRAKHLFLWVSLFLFVTVFASEPSTAWADHRMPGCSWGQEDEMSGWMAGEHNILFSWLKYLEDHEFDLQYCGNLFCLFWAASGEIPPDNFIYEVQIDTQANHAVFWTWCTGGDGLSPSVTTTDVGGHVSEMQLREFNRQIDQARAAARGKAVRGPTVVLMGVDDLR